jgi:hypothetical protein
MFSSQGVRGRILNKVLHKQHNRIYNYDSSTEYGSFPPCSQEASLQFLKMAHFDEGGRIFTYVITLDGMMRFTETGKEFGVDLLSKHTMHSDVATYVACAGEFLIRRRLAHPVQNHCSHSHNTHHEANHSREDSEGSSGPAPDHEPQPPDSDSALDHELNQRTHPPDPELPDGPPTSPPPRDPRLYQLVIDNDSGTYRPDESTLPDLQQFLQRNFPGLHVLALHCADERLAEMKRAQREAKKRESGGQLVRMVLNRSPSGSSFSSSDESRLGDLEGGAAGEEEEEEGEGMRSKKERAFDVLQDPGRWRDVLSLGGDNNHNTKAQDSKDKDDKDIKHDGGKEPKGEQVDERERGG